MQASEIIVGGDLLSNKTENVTSSLLALESQSKSSSKHQKNTCGVTINEYNGSTNAKVTEEVDLSVLEQQIKFNDDVSQTLNDLCGDVENIPAEVEAEVPNHDATPGEYFVTSTYEEMMGILEDYFDRTASRFVVQKRTKDFGVKGANFNLYKHRIQWEDTKNPNMCYEYNFLPFDGVPHITVGHYIMHCQFGQDASAAQKRKRRELKNAGKLPGKTRVLKHPTKKCGCPAKIHVKQIIKFPEYRIDKKTERRKRTGATKLKEKFLRNRHSILLDVYFMGRLPIIGEHKYHELMEGREFSKECVHKDLIIKAQELYMENFSLSTIMSALNSHIVNEMFYNQEPPSKKRRKYYPSRKDVRNFIGRIRQLSRFTKEEKKKISDLANVICSDVANSGVLFTFTEGESFESVDIEFSEDETEAENNSQHISYEDKPKEEKVQTFLSCYQSPEQQRLLKRYGNTVTLLVEVRHNTTVKRALTFKMFLLLVQTNVDFQAVGCVVFSKQRKNGLENGLALLKERNLFWTPKYVLIDCTEEINAVAAQLFPNSECFLNIKSCERLWVEFISTSSNGVQQHCQEIINYLKNMAYSYSEEFLSQSASHLEESDVWQKSEKLREWFQSDWLPIAKKWVVGYRPDDIFIFEHLKYDMVACLNVYEDLVSNSTRFSYGIAGMFETLHNVVAKEEYQRYVERNIYAMQMGRDLTPDEMLVDSLDGVSTFLKPVVYETCKEAAISNFSVANTQQLGVFTVTALPTKSISNILPPTATATGRTTPMDSTTTIESLMVAEMIRGIKAVDDSVMQVFNFTENVNNTSVVQGDGGRFMQDSSVVTAAGILVNSTTMNDSSTTMTAIENTVSEHDIETIGNCQDVVTTSVNTTEEFTVSFGDAANSQPFCSCLYWKQFKLPCVHMFYIFQKVPGWKYDMLSPVYRMNNVFHRDCACVPSVMTVRQTHHHYQSQLCFKCKDTVVMVAAQTQKNLGDYGIFLPATEFNPSEKLFCQVNDLLHHVNNLKHLFQDLVYYKNFRRQLSQLATTVRDKLIQEKITEDQLPGDISTLINEYLATLIQKCASSSKQPATSSDGADENTAAAAAATDFTVVAETNIQEISVAGPSAKEKTTTEPSCNSAMETVDDSNGTPPEDNNKEDSNTEDCLATTEKLNGDEVMILVPRNSSTTETTNSGLGETVVEINPLVSVPIVLEKGFPGGKDSKSNGSDVVVVSTPVKAEHIIVSSNGLKRNSRILTDVSDDDDKGGFKKMSILEYLPLLKKKCIHKPPNAQPQPVRDLVVTTTTPTSQ